jgi:Na+-driven multidrug efflux pump
MVTSVEMLAAYSVTGNLGRLFLVVCFGLGMATGVMVGNTIGEGADEDEIMDLSQALLDFTTVVGFILAAVSLLLVPTLFQPVVFPLFKLYGTSADIATALAVAAFAATPIHAFAISAVTGVLRSGGDVRFSTVLDIGPQWLFALPLTALTALVLKTGCWPVAIAIQSENLLKVPLCLWRINSRKWIHDVTVKEDV